MAQEELSTTGLNIIMTWRTGSDLEIQVENGETLGMVRTSNQGQGNDASRREPNEPAKETLNFADESLIVGKEIKFKVVNSRQNSDLMQNQFDLKIINAHGEKLFPEGDEREGWMVCTKDQGNLSEERSYTVTQADIDRGINGTSNSFEDHAKFIAKQLDDQQWDFTQSEAQQKIENADMNNNQVNRNEKYQEKWQIVKDLLCGEDFFDCKDLEQVL